MVRRRSNVPGRPAEGRTGRVAGNARLSTLKTMRFGIESKTNAEENCGAFGSIEVHCSIRRPRLGVTIGASWGVIKCPTMSSPDDATLPQPAVQIVEVTQPTVTRAELHGPGRPAGWWLPAALIGALVGLLAGAYLFAPLRTNILLLGIDSRPGEGAVSRTDTMVLTTFQPGEPYVGMLSIPRDLWVTLPDGQQNRINTAHFFAESSSPGTGPTAAMQAVRQNFGVHVHAYVRLDFGAVREFVDGFGGVELDLPEPMSGYPAGRSTLDGAQALAFVRDRAGSDDFARMARGQLFLRAVLRELSEPAAWPRLPRAAAALAGSVRTDAPIWLWPRLAMALLRVGPGGIDARVIDSQMVSGFTTPAGAQVLSPDWSAINPVLLDMFGE